MVLFSTLSSSKKSIPTLVQLYTEHALTLHPNVEDSPRHAVLSFQAIDVESASTESTEEELFGHKRKAAGNKSIPHRPDLGVWNCRCQPVALADHLLRIPKTPYFCFTVDLADPSQVEPTLSVLHEALVRLVISASPRGDKNCATTLYDLKSNQFGLAPKDNNPTSSLAPEEEDRGVRFGLIICAIRASRTAEQEDYRQTQAQNLVWYHLRRYAAALNASLCLVQMGSQSDGDEQQQPALTVSQLTRVWKAFSLGDQSNLSEYYRDDGQTPIYGPEKPHADMVESVLLRNAECPGHWDAAKDSLWAALPPSPPSASIGGAGKGPKSSGDEAWLSQLQQSVGGTTERSEQAATATPSPAPKKDDDEAVSSFFENLLKK